MHPRAEQAIDLALLWARCRTCGALVPEHSAQTHASREHGRVLSRRQLAEHFDLDSQTTEVSPSRGTCWCGDPLPCGCGALEVATAPRAPRGYWRGRSAEKHRTRQAAFYQRQRSLGRCVRCATPAHDGGTLCPRHRAADTAYWARRRAARRNSGVCPDCGQPPAEGLVKCRVCIDQEANRRRRWVAAGLCRRCKAPAQAGRKTCARHAEADRIRVARARRAA